MIFLASILLILYAVFTLNILIKISNGKLIYLLLYIIIFLPFFHSYQSLIYLYSESEIIIDLIKFSKDIVLYFSFFIILFGHKGSILFRKYYFSFLDKLMH